MEKMNEKLEVRFAKLQATTNEVRTALFKVKNTEHAEVMLEAAELDMKMVLEEFQEMSEHA